MKKIILIVVTFLITVLNVNAESIEYNGYIPGYNTEFIMSSKMDDKYVIMRTFDVVLLSSSGKYENLIECDLSLLVEDELVCFNAYYDSESSTSSTYITLYDSSFNEKITKQYDITYGDINNSIIITKYNDYYVLLDREFLEIVDILDSNLNEISDDVYYEIAQYYDNIFESIFDSIVNANYDFAYIVQIKNNQYLLFAGADSYYGTNVDFLLYDEIGNIVTKLDIPIDNIINGVSGAIANDGIYVAYLSEVGELFLEKYDKNGKELYNYSLSKLINNSFSTGLNLYNIYVDENEVNITISDPDASKHSLDSLSLPNEPLDDADSYLISFKINYDITTNITGFGDLNVEETGVYNEEKVMQITPEPGNEISDLVITDSAGNNISYTDDYKFIMPNSDVVIDVTFELKTATPSGNEIDIENPSTGAVLPISILIGGIIVSFVIYNYTKKKRVFTKL